MLYEYEGNVLVGAKPQDEGHQAPPTTGWIVRGKLTLQRQSELVLAAAVSCLGSVPVSEMFQLISGKRFSILFLFIQIDPY